MTGLVAAVRREFGEQVLEVSEGFGPWTVEVRAGAWVGALTALRTAGGSLFDFLTAYDDLPAGFVVVAHVGTPDATEHVLLRTRLPRADPSLDSAVGVYRGAAWHERETHEMFGIDFPGHPGLTPLLLPASLSARPLRKDFVLVSRVVKPWPGAADAGAPSRRATAVPGVPPGWGRPDAGAGS